MQIVRTRLRRDLNAITLRLAQDRHRIRRRQVNDVNARVEFTTEPDHHLDRFSLSRTWPRLEKRLIFTRRNYIGLHWTSQLGVHDQQRIESRQLRPRLTQVCLSHMLKLIHARWNQKTLEPNHAPCKHRRQLSRVPRHRSEEHTSD